MMAVVPKLRYLIIISVLHSRFSYNFPHKLPYNGVKIVTYGESCYPPRHLSVAIEEPVKPVVELVSSKSCIYQSLKLNYRIISNQPILNYPQEEYPISIQVPEVLQPLEIITPDPLREKSYMYNTQIPPPPSVPISTNYNFDVQGPPPSLPEISTPQYVKFLTGLTGRIDRVLIPACEVASSN